MRDAQQGDFNILLAEALDRISRDQADVATLFKHLKFAGVIIVTLAEGEITELHVGLKGTMNALFLKDLAMKTHRAFALREISAAFPCRIKISSAKAAVDHAAPLPRPFRIARSAAGILGAEVYPRAHRNYARLRNYGSYNINLKRRIPYVRCGGRLVGPMGEWDAEAVAAAMNAVLHPRSNRHSGG